MRKILLASLATIVVFLQSCSTVASSSAQALYNHHSFEKNATDAYLTLRAYQAIGIESKHFKKTNINIATLNRMVLLSGQVFSPEQRDEAEEIVRDLQGVGQVYNWIAIQKPSSQLARLNDAWLTAKIKTKLLLSDEVDASAVKVVSENRTVFLMGVLRPSEARAALQIASTTEGVDQVVKIFSYLNLSKIPLEG